MPGPGLTATPSKMGLTGALCSSGITLEGDIKGAVGVQILGISGNVYHVQHHWVTESGDTIYVKDAFLTPWRNAQPCCEAMMLRLARSALSRVRDQQPPSRSY
jgi:hypothetical protein